MNAVALARLDDPLAGSKHALRRSGFPCILASGLTSLQPSNDVGEKSSSYDEHAPGSLFWTQKDPIRLDGGVNVYDYAGDDPINHTDRSGKDWSQVADCVVAGGSLSSCIHDYLEPPYPNDCDPTSQCCPNNYSPAQLCQLKCVLAAGVCVYILKRDPEFCGTLLASCFERCPSDGSPN